MSYRGGDNESILILVTPVQTLSQHQLSAVGGWPSRCLLGWGEAEHAVVVQGECYLIVVRVTVVVCGIKSISRGQKKNW